MNTLINNVKVPLFSFCLSCLIFLLMTSESYDSYRYAIALPLVLFSIVFLFVKKPYVSKIGFGVVSVSIMLCVAFGVFYSLPTLTFKNNIDNYNFVIFVASTIFKIFCCYTIFELCRGNLALLVKVISAVIIIHVAMFVLQTIVVYGTGYYIDVLEPVTGEAQRYEGLFSLPVIGNIYRATGFFIEPSTYATYVLWLLAIRIMINGKVNKSDLYIAGTTVITLSLAAIVYGLMFFLVLFQFSKIKIRTKLLCYTVFSFLPFIFISIFDARLNALNGSGESLRYNLLNYVFSQDLGTILLGNGVMGLPDEVAALSNTNDLWRLGFAALNDNGLWLFLIIKVGLLGLFSVIFAVMCLVKDMTSKMLFLVLMLTKINFLSFTFIFYIFVTMLVYLYHLRIKKRILSESKDIVD
ncbi:hypothetical protein [Pseudomonas graminis]